MTVARRRLNVKVIGKSQKTWLRLMRSVRPRARVFFYFECTADKYTAMYYCIVLTVYWLQFSIKLRAIVHVCMFVFSSVRAIQYTMLEFLMKYVT